MNWEKKGLIYGPSGNLWWAKSHGYLPTAEIIQNKCIRVYFSSRDKNRIGRIGYVDLNINNPKEILFSTKEPILDTGRFGSFDESGVSPSCVIAKATEKRLYYFGWQKNTTGAYLLFCGLAISHDNGKTFERYSKVPILDRTDREPFVRSAVSIIEDNGIYRMWYVSGTGWTEFNHKPCPTYIIRYAESTDGILWDNTDKICIKPVASDEFGFGRPWVVKDDNLYKMWYSIRTKTKPYYIGYAESIDGLSWDRKDNKAGIRRSQQGWDSEMICFSSVIRCGSRQIMFYNGNRHGIDGFGYAQRNLPTIF